MRETPEVSEAINELLLHYGNAPWFYDAKQSNDDAGARLLVLVVDELYAEDVLPRKLGQCFLVVQRVPEAGAGGGYGWPDVLDDLYDQEEDVEGS